MEDDYIVPQLIVNDDGSLSVGIEVDDVPVDVTDVSVPEYIQEVEDAVQSGVHLDVSGNSVTGVTLDFEDFLSIIGADEEVPPDVSENDMDIMALAVDGNQTSSNSFTPQQWQLNLAQNRPIGAHYVMTRTGTSNQSYILVIGRDITYDGINTYMYHDCDFYSVYTTGSSSSLRYHYDVSTEQSGSVSASSYVVYSDLFFDYVGGRFVPYSFIIFFVILIIFAALMFFRRKE